MDATPMCVTSICLVMLIMTVLLCYIASGLHVSWLIILTSLLAFLCIVMYIAFMLHVHHGLQRQLVSRVIVVPATCQPTSSGDRNGPSSKRVGDSGDGTSGACAMCTSNSGASHCVLKFKHVSSIMLHRK